MLLVLQTQKSYVLWGILYHLIYHLNHEWRLHTLNECPWDNIYIMFCKCTTTFYSIKKKLYKRTIYMEGTKK